MRATLLGLIVVVVAACSGGTDQKRVGESCVASSECAAGLLCDLSQDPHVCANMGSLDAAIMIDAAVIVHHPDGHPTDARPIDAAIDAPPDAP